jgi:GAF domain-containing protein
MSGQQRDSASRETLTASTFVTLIDTLVDEFDVIDVLTVLASRSVELLGAAAAGILLADSSGELRVMAASSEQIALLELFQIQNEQGPCMDSYRTGEVVANADLRSGSQWPQFAVESIAAGYPSVCAVPLRLRSVILGCLNLFMSAPEPLAPADVHLAQSLADVASIAIVQDQAARDAASREGRLQHALNSRIAIEQAKGMLAEHLSVDMDGAFALLRTFARDHNRGLTEVAESLVGGALAIAAVGRAHQ